MEWTVATPQELVGAMFTNPTELRHLAEQQFGELFVPIEVLAESPHSAVIQLTPRTIGPVVLHAERARHWYPVRVTHVEVTPAAPSSNGSGGPDRPRVVPIPGRINRPRIDWL